MKMIPVSAFMFHIRENVLKANFKLGLEGNLEVRVPINHL